VSERPGKACGRNPSMYAVEKSDIGVVPKKGPNNVAESAPAEVPEGRPVTEGKFWKDRL
jgi:hypothetical protein